MPEEKKERKAVAAKAKEEKKGTKMEKGEKEEPVRKSRPKEVKGEKVRATKEEKALQEKLKGKSKQVFRGRFGKSATRRKSNKKWQKWRVPRGIDFNVRTCRVKIPKTGYRTEKSIRGLHPSGKEEILIHNEAGLSSFNGKKAAVRIAAAVGKKKRITIRKKCSELGIKVLN